MFTMSTFLARTGKGGDNEPVLEPTTDSSYHHGDLANALIEAGLALLAEGGAETLTLRSVARRAGVSHAAPYRHFADREALFAAIATQGFFLLAEAMRAATLTFPVDPIRRYRACGVAYVRFATARPHHFRIMFAGVTGSRLRFPRLQEAAETALAVLVATIREAQEAGEVRRDREAQEIALASWSMVHGIALLVAGEQFPTAAREKHSPEEFTDEYVGLLMEGVANNVVR